MKIRKTNRFTRMLRAKSAIVAIVSAAAWAVAVPATSASASILGDTIKAEYAFPTLDPAALDSHAAYAIPGTFTVAPGLLTTYQTYPISTVSYSASGAFETLTFGFNTGFSAPGYNNQFNGPVLRILSGSDFGSIASVVGSPVQIINTGRVLAIDFSGQNYTSSDTIAITFNAGTVSAVPLPASAPMFGAALVGLGVAGFRIRRRTGASAV